MKRILSTAIMAAATLMAAATDYTTPMTVTAGTGHAEFTGAVVSVEDNGDGTCNVTLKNISYKTGSEETAVGTVVLEKLAMTKAGVYTLIRGNAGIEIQAGDDAKTSWQGTSYAALCGGKVPAYFIGELRGGKLYANVLLDTYGATKQSIAITLGDGSYTVGQMANGGFEAFHTATAGSATSDEPDAWHSFMSCTGSLKSFVNKTPHTFLSNEVRPGSNGKKSVLVTSSKILGIVANGTITTGQMNAGAMSAADTKNNAFLDFTNTDADANGDPFYMTADAAPDSIALWVKFVQGTPNADYPYATMSAAITDGTKYQDPEAANTSDDNVAAKAKNTQIATCGGVWQKLTMPFDYASYAASNAAVNAILVTISTNATPGKGSATDSLNVDDAELIYNARLSALKFNGADVEGFAPDKFSGYEVDSKQAVKLDDIEAVADGHGAVVSKTLTRTDGTPGKAEALVTVVSADLKTVNRYAISFTEPGTNGINSVETSINSGESATQIYSISGQRMSKMRPGGIYLLKVGGKTVKIVKK